jgi:hypothetical protein
MYFQSPIEISLIGDELGSPRITRAGRFDHWFFAPAWRRAISAALANLKRNVVMPTIWERDMNYGRS